MKTESFEKPSARGQLNRYEKKLETFSMLGYARHMEILWISNVHGKGCAFSNVLSERFFSAFPSIFRKKEKKPILIKSFSKSSIFIIIILMLVLLSGCIETGHPIVEIDVKYGKHKIYGENNNVVATYEIKKGKNGDDVEIYAENYGHVKINGMKGNPKKMHVQAGLADFNTPIIAVNESVTFEKAEITLMKTGFVNKIFYCSGWNMEQFSCSEWVKTNLSLVANSTHIVFTVDHFTAYAGGVGYESNLTVWDDSDEKAVGENQNVYFYANFTNATSGNPINGTGVNCSIAFGEQKEMRWNATSLLHEYNTSFSAPGTFSWNVTCNGTSLGYDFLNTTDTVLILDTTNPVVNIQLPLNATNMTTQGINFTATDNVAVDKCWYSIGSGNTSLSNCANISSITGEQQGFNRLRVYANDTTGNIGMNEINYTLDSKGPVIKDLTEMPTDPAEYLASQFYEFNATITDAQRAVSSVWIEWNGTNYTSIYNTGSIYSFNRSNLPIASHSYKWYANDSLGNENATAMQTYIVRDTTSPVIAIQFPQNRSYTNTTMNFTAVDQAFGVCWYSLNRGTTNTSLPSCSNLSSIGTEGFNELWLWANDTTGNENVAKINFTKDLTGPFILLGNPANNSWSASSSNTFYYTPYDNSTIANCTLVIDSAYNQSNASAVSKGTANTMAAGLADGTHLWTVNCTDELGNQGTNTTAKTINIDTITPVVQIVYPQNATYTTTSLHLNFTFTEQNRDSCWYSLNNGANTTITGCANGTAITAMHGHNNITLWMNDSAGNTGSGSVFFVQNNAPGIVNQNATSGATGVISNATNPTNNNTFVRFTAEYSDADSDNATVYICKQDDGNRYGCGAGSQWCSYSTRDGTNPKTCDYTLTSSESAESYNYYAFISDSYTSTNQSGTFNVNHPPSVASAVIAPSTAYETSVLNCTNGTITDDSSDTVTLSYKWYKNSAEIAGQTQWNLTGSSFNHYDNITCEIMPTDNHNYAGAARNSTTIQIKNSPPVVSIGNTFTDYTTQHAFNVTATATDADGLADITSCKIWRRTGSDAYVSEAGEISSGNCIAKIDTTDSDGSGAFAVNDNISIMVEFFDASDSTNTTASLHAIPNQPPSASNGDVLPSSPNTTQTLTCSYTFSDLEGDADNSTFKWYKDNVVQAGLNSATVSGSYTTEGETWKCEIAPIDQYGGTGSAINSTNETIVNSPPTISIGNTFTDYTTEHAFNVTATASDADGLTDITSCKVWRRTGSDAHVSESGIYISATGNCTAKINTSDSDGGGTFAVYDSVDIKVEFFDEAESVNTSSSSNSIPNRAPETSTPALVPATVYKNTANITCANTTTTDADSDNVTFHYKWFNNSAVITGAITNYLTNDSYAHFNNITCQIMPDDSYINGSARNVSVVITNTPPAVASSEIVPAVAYETTVLNCTNGSVSDIDSDVVTLLYKWYKNSAVISGQTQWNLTGTYFNHFDNVTCQITPYDGYDSGTPVNATAVQILNTVPAISNVAVTPSIAYTNDTLTCSGTFADVDSDTEAGSTFKWYRNGTVIDGQTNRQLNAYVIRKHENVSCEYRPKDGYDFGSAANSTMVTILNAKPIVSSVSILPSPAYENSVLNCTNGTVTDRDNDTITLFYKWYRNGSEIGQVAWNLTGTYFNHFDNVTCQITPYDNDENGTAINSSTLQISNTPPTLDSASIVPATAYETSVLNCTNGSTSDVDADSVTLLYKWYKNSIVISGQTQWNLTGTYFNHFDNVTCQITPYDGYDSGTPVNASAVSILNTPPVIANVAVTPSIAYTNDTLTCDGTFTDVDSDAEAGSMFKWYRNGTVIDGQTNRQLSAYVIRKHENVSCEYRPKDGYDFGSAANSTMVTILNAKPITTLTNITPKIAYETSVLNCTNGTIIDRDNDTITLFYKWYRNGSEIGQVAWNLTGTYFNHFDNITCQIMPYDTEENGTSANDTIEIQNSLPVIYFINVTPSADGWGETFTFITNVSDVDNDSVNISLWLSSNNATWSYDRTTNCTSCLQKTKINITKTDFTCSNIGQNFFRINATDEYGATNISWSANFTLLKSTLNQGNMVITQGDGTRVGTRGTESTHITVSIYDSKRNIFVTSGVRGRIWVMKNSTLWNTGQPCTTTSNGNCTITFDPDCTYQGDAREFRGGIYNDTCYFDVNSTTGHIIIDPGVECMHEITFVLELNISGTEDDVFRTSAGTGDAFFISGETTQYYICVEDAAIEKIPVFGIVFSGDDFSTLNISSRKMQMSQYQAGNMFIMPVTYGGCSAIQRKIDLIKNNRFLTQPYAWFNDNTYPLEISLDYPVNIRGEESLKGSFILTLEKNGSTIDAKVR